MLRVKVANHINAILALFVVGVGGAIRPCPQGQWSREKMLRFCVSCLCDTQRCKSPSSPL